MKLTLCFAVMAFFLSASPIQALSLSATRSVYEIKVYHIKSKAQETRMDKYLQEAYIPALHRAGIASVGVFKPVETDTAAFGKLIYVMSAFKSLDQMSGLTGKLLKDADYLSAGHDYLDAAYNEQAYERMETMVLRAFADMPAMKAPELTNSKSERIYELRSYEGATEKLYAKKVSMFNEGKEIGIFSRLGMGAVFYAEVLVGSHQPNLMYMTSFKDKATRDKLWEEFKVDAYWKKISGMDEYQHTVSHADIFFLHPAEYSDF